MFMYCHFYHLVTYSCYMATFEPRVVRDPAALGRAIRARRGEIGWTQAELAERGVTNRYAVIKAEDGVTTKALQTLFDLLYALDLELSVAPRAHAGGPAAS